MVQAWIYYHVTLHQNDSDSFQFIILPSLPRTHFMHHCCNKINIVNMTMLMNGQDIYSLGYGWYHIIYILYTSYMLE